MAARAARAARARGPGQGRTRDEGTTKDKSMILSASFGHVITLTVAATKKTTIGDTDNCIFMTLVNSISMAPPIGLLLKGVKFCHTSNTLLVVHQCHHALLRLYFNSSAVGWLVVA
jgi:hypothetical protein